MKSNCAKLAGGSCTFRHKPNSIVNPHPTESQGAQTQPIMRKNSLLVALALTTLSTVWAEDFRVANSDGVMIPYKILNTTDNEVEVDQGGNYQGDVVVPSTVTNNGITYTVTGIGGWAFNGKGDMTSITLPNTITVIGRSAFESCHKLTSLTIPASVTTINDYCFYGLKNVKTIEFCEPANLTTLGKNAFGSQSNLESVNIPSSITTIPESLFEQCSSLKKIVITSNVETIGQYAFSQCTSMESIEFEKGSNLKEIKKAAFEICESLKSVTLPASVEILGDRAFDKCTSLKEAVIPAKVTDIGSYVFGTNDNITSLTALMTAPCNPGWGLVSDEAFKTCKLYVPKGCKETYANAFVWDQFQNIEEITEAGVGTIEAGRTLRVNTIGQNIEVEGTEEGEAIAVYDMAGHTIYAGSAKCGSTIIPSVINRGAVYIIKVGKTTIKHQI